MKSRNSKSVVSKNRSAQAGGDDTGHKLEQRNRELAVLNRIAEELNRAVDVKSALENSLRLVAELLELKTGWVWLLDETSGEPHLAASQQLPPFLTAKPSRMQGKDCLCLSTFLSGDLTGAANVNVLECSRLLGGVDGTDGLRYHASIPLYAHDKPLGVMNVAGSDWRGLASNDLQLLYTIGYQIGVAIERARLFDQTVRLATTEERNRLAREIHDTIAQGMAGVILNLESADVLLDDPDPLRRAKGRDKLTKALSLTRANLEEARRSVLDLRATPLQTAPLAQAIAALVETFRAENPVKAFFKLKNQTEATRRYPARVEAGVYRVAQEALTNVAKHAQATRLKVILLTELRNGRERLILTIQDDGRGFDLNRPDEPVTDGQKPHFGLIGMNERARLIGGQLEIKSCPGEGTVVRMIVPLS